MEDIVIVSAMICYPPKYLKGRFILSAYQGVWEAVKELPSEVKPYVTDDVGNNKVEYGGLLQFTDVAAFAVLSKMNLFACFRGVLTGYIDYVQAYPPANTYQNWKRNLKFMGWDISTSNGWASASCEGIFPINPFTGENTGANSSQLNEYALFDTLDECMNYCHINDKKIPESVPWYPVAVYVDEGSNSRLQILKGTEKGSGKKGAATTPPPL